MDTFPSMDTLMDTDIGVNEQYGHKKILQNTNISKDCGVAGIRTLVQ